MGFFHFFSIFQIPNFINTSEVYPEMLARRLSKAHRLLKLVPSLIDLLAIRVTQSLQRKI